MTDEEKHKIISDYFNRNYYKLINSIETYLKKCKLWMLLKYSESALHEIVLDYLSKVKNYTYYIRLIDEGNIERYIVKSAYYMLTNESSIFYRDNIKSNQNVDYYKDEDFVEVEDGVEEYNDVEADGVIIDYLQGILNDRIKVDGLEWFEIKILNDYFFSKKTIKHLSTKYKMSNTQFYQMYNNARYKLVKQLKMDGMYNISNRRNNK